MKFIAFIIICCAFYLSPNIIAQTVSSEVDMEFRGSIASNKSNPSEFFEQWRTALWGLALDSRKKVQVGVSKRRIGNQDVVELPLLFKYQVHERVQVYAGVQAAFTRDLNQESNSSPIQMQATFGANYDITPIWDAGIQFVVPLVPDANLPGNTFEKQPPIRLRTGVKF